MSRPDDVEIVELGLPPTEPPAEPATDVGDGAAGPRRARRRGVLAVAALALVLLAGLAVVVLRSPGPRPSAAPARSVVSLSVANTYPRGAFSCDDPGTCVISPRGVPTAGVAAALHQYFPTLTGATAQIYLEPGNAQIRSQYVTGATPSGITVTVSLSYDGDIFYLAPAYHKDFAPTPTLFFNRHTYEGWQVEVTVGGTAAAQTLVKQGLALVSDGRLFD